MPEEFREYFWDTEFEKLDIRKNKRYIIARLYCYGDLSAIKWIKECYSLQDIEDVARNCRNLKPLVANYLRQQFNLRKDEMAYYKWANNMNYEYWRVKNYPNKLIKELISAEEMPKLKMASILDIAIMKIIAIGGRGAKKDFFDLYNIINLRKINISELVKGIIIKYGNNINYVNTIMGLSYFEDAEQEILPKAFVEYDWEEIKKFFIDFQIKFQKEIEVLV